jgi:hypothetical protein
MSMPSDLIRGPAPDLIRGWRPVRVKTRQIENLEPRFDSIETEKALEIASGRYVSASGGRFKYDNRGTGLSVPSGAKERVPDAGKNEDGKAEADDRQRKH